MLHGATRHDSCRVFRFPVVPQRLNHLLAPLRKLQLMQLMRVPNKSKNRFQQKPVVLASCLYGTIGHGVKIIHPKVGKSVLDMR